MAQTPAKEAPEYAPLRPPCRELPPRRRRVTKLVAVVIQPRRRRSDRGERMLTVATLSNGRERVPMIRLRGRWLARLGFTRNARIVVSEEHGPIVLTLAGEE